MIDLTQVGVAFTTKHGIEKAAEMTGRPKGAAKDWAEGKQPSVRDLQKMIETDPEILGSPPQASATEPMVLDDAPPAAAPASGIAPYAWPEGKRIAILMPSNRAPHLHLLKCFATLFERDKMQFIPLKTNMPPSRGRNWLAQRWLDSGCELGYFWDDDVVLPHGDVGWYRDISGNPNFPADYAQINPIARLMSQNKTFIGGCYFGRNDNGRAQYATAMASNMADDSAHTGPRNFVEETPWVGMGATLVHVNVLRDIIKTQPEVEIKNGQLAQQLGYRFRFFNSMSAYGEDSENSEDVAFCARARIAGHKVWVDHAVVPLHMGERAYCYHNTRKMQPQFY